MKYTSAHKYGHINMAGSTVESCCERGDFNIMLLTWASEGFFAGGQQG